jgi:hypothetical protein
MTTTPTMTLIRTTILTRPQFEQLADAAVRAIGWSEGWCDEHPSWRIHEDDTVTATPRFRALFREQLTRVGVRVAPLNRENSRHLR